MRFRVRSAMDAWSVKETILDAFYTRYGTPVKDGWTIIDIGAGIGDFSIYAAFARPKVSVLAFEPFPDSFDLLAKNLSDNQVDNVLIFQTAVWEGDGELLLDLSSGEPLQIGSLEHGEVVKSEDTLKVQSISLNSLLIQNQLEQVDLLKLDCEGAEYKILMNAPHGALIKIRRIIMEYHDLDEKHNHRVLMTFLKEQGFQVRQYGNIVHAEIGYLYAER